MSKIVRAMLSVDVPHLHGKRICFRFPGQVRFAGLLSLIWRILFSRKGKQTHSCRSTSKYHTGLGRKFSHATDTQSKRQQQFQGTGRDFSFGGIEMKLA